MIAGFSCVSPIVFSSERNPIASCVAWDSAIYSASVEDNATGDFVFGALQIDKSNNLEYLAGSWFSQHNVSKPVYINVAVKMNVPISFWLMH